MNTLIVYAPNVRYLLKFPLFSPFSRFWEIRIIVATCFETFSIAVFVLEEWFPLAKFHRSFVFAPLLHFKTPRLSPLHRYRSNLWRASFFSAKKKKKPGRDQFQYDRQHSSRCLKDIWVLHEVAKLDVTGKDVWDERTLEEILEL